MVIGERFFSRVDDKEIEALSIKDIVSETLSSDNAADASSAEGERRDGSVDDDAGRHSSSSDMAPPTISRQNRCDHVDDQ